ncbi:hypothetical protein ACFRCG_06915 [Embleya sp. NPDC056575]|uniref:hypothetical protein n=1 Tax=unclassified Embleya TaxID=2699296 RepID=UPI0036C24755
MERLTWDALSVRTRTAVHALTGPIHTATPVEAGHHSALAVHLDTADGPVFVKVRCHEGSGQGPNRVVL